MAICTKCGSVFHDEDEHECKLENVPAQGTEIIQGVKVINEKANK